MTRVFKSGTPDIPGGSLEFPSDILNRSDITQYTYFAPHDKYASYGGIETDVPKGQIYLPLPKELNASYKTAWETKDLAEEAAATVGAVSKKAGAVVSGVKGIFDNGFVKEATHGIINPFKAVQWKGPEIRTFSFTFELIASSGKEADIINRIIWTFKKFMHTPDSYTSMTGLRQPPLWNIKFVDAVQNSGGSAAAGNKYLFQLKDCAMSDFSVDYTNKGNAFHSTGLDGKGFHAPNGVKISISFTETSILTQEDFGQDYQEKATY